MHLEGGGGGQAKAAERKPPWGRQGEQVLTQDAWVPRAPALGSGRQDASPASQPLPGSGPRTEGQVPDPHPHPSTAMWTGE